MLRRIINTIVSNGTGSFESYYQRVLQSGDIRTAPSASEARRDYQASLRQQQRGITGGMF